MAIKRMGPATRQRTDSCPSWIRRHVEDHESTSFPGSRDPTFLPLDFVLEVWNVEGNQDDLSDQSILTAGRGRCYPGVRCPYTPRCEIGSRPAKEPEVPGDLASDPDHDRTRASPRTYIRAVVPALLSLIPRRRPDHKIRRIPQDRLNPTFLSFSRFLPRLIWTQAISRFILLKIRRAPRVRS